MRDIHLCILFLFISSCLLGQVIPSNRTTDWTVAGLSDPIDNPVDSLCITDFGGNGDGSTANDQAFQDALNSLNGDGGSIYFPAGHYLFEHSFSLPSNTRIYGVGAQYSILRFTGDNNANLISVHGGMTDDNYTIQTAYQGEYVLHVTSGFSGINPGDYLRLQMDGGDYMESDWAVNCMAQIVRVESISGTDIHLHSPLRHDFPADNNPFIRKINPAHDVQIDQVKILRDDNADAQRKNISFYNAVNCKVLAIESQYCDFCHIGITSSSNIEVYGSYFHDAFGYGGGGRAYGVEIDNGAGENLVENNIFRNLRHSMLAQSGANGNVFLNNYSREPYWDEFGLPANSAGDMVLHGNYPYMNLFEGNVAQNLVVDDSHGINGPYNSFFRNRLELYGIFMNFNPSSDNVNFVGNEVTDDGFTTGMYSLHGDDHFEYGNNVDGDIKPSGTGDLTQSSCCLDGPPCYFMEMGLNWPAIGPPNSIDSEQNHAQARFHMDSFTYLGCEDAATFKKDISVEPEISVYPNPCKNTIQISIAGTHHCTGQITVYDSQGRSLLHTYTNGKINLETLSAGMYILQYTNENSKLLSTRFIKQ